jgi:hypothetical protein
MRYRATIVKNQVFFTAETLELTCMLIEPTTSDVGMPFQLGWWGEWTDGSATWCSIHVCSTVSTTGLSDPLML